MLAEHVGHSTVATEMLQTHSHASMHRVRLCQHEVPCPGEDLHCPALPHRSDEDKSGDWQAIDAAESVWCLDEAAEDREGEPAKSLMITLARPAPTESEITWKKGLSLIHTLHALMVWRLNSQGDQP